jgi:hypothetical protein
VTVTVPATTVTVPAGTTTSEITVTVSVPSETVTAPGTTTVVTLPVVTETIDGDTVVRPSVTITLAGTTTTVAGGATATVVTVVGPNKAVRHGVLATKHASVAVKTPRRTVRVDAHVVRVLGGKFAGKKVVVVVVRSGGCPPGTVLYHGSCSGVVRGKG